MIEALLEQLAPYLESEPKLTSVQAEQVLRKAYLFHYHFSDANSLAAQPASLVRFHSAEDSFRGSMMEDHAEHFADLDIGDVFRISWLEYVSLPRHEMQILRNIAEKIKKRKISSDNNSLDEAEKLLRAAGRKVGGG